MQGSVRSVNSIIRQEEDEIELTDERLLGDL